MDEPPSRLRVWSGRLRVPRHSRPSTGVRVHALRCLRSACASNPLLTRRRSLRGHLGRVGLVGRVRGPGGQRERRQHRGHHERNHPFHDAHPISEKRTCNAPSDKVTRCIRGASPGEDGLVRGREKAIPPGIPGSHELGEEEGPCAFLEPRGKGLFSRRRVRGRRQNSGREKFRGEDSMRNPPAPLSPAAASSRIDLPRGQGARKRVARGAQPPALARTVTGRRPGTPAFRGDSNSGPAGVRAGRRAAGRRGRPGPLPPAAGRPRAPGATGRGERRGR